MLWIRHGLKRKWEVNIMRLFMRVKKFLESQNVLHGVIGGRFILI